MTARLPQEQPPVEGQPRLTEWLSRLVILINASLTTIFDIEFEREKPTVVSEGMIRLFKAGVFPEITHTGPWIYIEGAWRPMIDPPV